MELYFNELSLNEDFTQSDINQFQGVYGILYKYDITSCRIRMEDFATIISCINSMDSVRNNIHGFLYSFFKTPFEDESVNNIDEEYYESEWTCEEMSCIGMAIAYLMDSASLSVSRPLWDNNLIQIKRSGALIEVRNISNSTNCKSHASWFESSKEIVLEKCLISPRDKKIDLRDDHGKDELLRFASRIVNSEYVCEIVNSIPFQANRRRFVKRIKEDGIIEIVLPWTDKGYGLAVKTTGRNIRETKVIAEILKEEYGKL